MVEVKCPECGKMVSIKEEWFWGLGKPAKLMGKKPLCPECGKKMRWKPRKVKK